jgi:hypothetical protein
MADDNPGDQEKLADEKAIVERIIIKDFSELGKIDEPVVATFVVFGSGKYAVLPGDKFRDLHAISFTFADNKKVLIQALTECPDGCDLIAPGVYWCGQLVQDPNRPKPPRLPRRRTRPPS